MGQIEEELQVELGRNIRKARKAARVRQQHLAAEIRVHRNTLMRWEHGEVAVPLWKLVLIADLLGVKPSALVPPRRVGGCQ